jgi:hypothetical protein
MERAMSPKATGGEVVAYTAQAWSPDAGRYCDVHHDRPASWRLVEHPDRSIGEPWLAVTYACDDCKQAAAARGHLVAHMETDK